MKREKATELLRECIERAVAGEGRAALVSDIWLFGSYARGALEPHDLDLLAFHEVDDEFRRQWDEMITLWGSPDPRLPIRRAIAGGRRRAQVEPAAAPARELKQLSGPFVPIWSRGDSVEIALERAAAIVPDPDAGRADRDEHPTLEGLDRWLGPGGVQGLTKAIRARGLQVERLQLPEEAPHNGLYELRSSWKPGALNQDTAIARARQAGLRHVEKAGFGSLLFQEPDGVTFTAGRASYPSWSLREPFEDEDDRHWWLYVVNGTAKRQPIEALSITTGAGIPEHPRWETPLELWVLVSTFSHDPRHTGAGLGPDELRPLAEWLAPDLSGAAYLITGWVEVRAYAIQAVGCLRVDRPENLVRLTELTGEVDPMAGMIALLTRVGGPPPQQYPWRAERPACGSRQDLEPFLWTTREGVRFDLAELLGPRATAHHRLLAGAERALDAGGTRNGSPP